MVSPCQDVCVRLAAGHDRPSRGSAQRQAQPDGQQQASMKDSLLRSPVVDRAGPDTPEQAVQQKHGQECALYVWQDVKQW